MNERIEKFARECGAWDQVYDQKRFMVDGNFDVEKFAELIVKECEQVSLKNSHRDNDMGAIIAKQIKEHFGVEE